MKILFYTSISLILFYSSFSKGEGYAGWTVGEARDGYGAIYATTDSGNNWVRQGSNQIANVNMFGVFAVNPKTAWVVGNADSGYATIYNTVDGGQIWNRKGFGQTALQDISLSKVHVSSNNIWAIGMDAILRSSDSGNSWTNCLPIEYTNTLLQGLFSIDGYIVWVGGEGTNASDFATILKSENAGQTWTRQTVGGITNANHILGISAANSQTAWAVGGNGFLIYHTENGGGTWVKQPSQGGLGDANEVYAIDTQSVWVACDNFIELSNDGGATWTDYTMTYYAMGMTAVSTQEAWTAIRGFDGTGTIWHTKNGGTDWEQQTIPVGSRAPLWTISFAQQAIPEPGFYLLIVIYQLLFISYRKKFFCYAK
ncbi:hypothetical protein KAH27_06275 [bacterium]|nr:hypothetical protein [bacterium]